MTQEQSQPPTALCVHFVKSTQKETCAKCGVPYLRHLLPVSEDDFCEKDYRANCTQCFLAKKFQGPPKNDSAAWYANDIPPPNSGPYLAFKEFEHKVVLAGGAIFVDSKFGNDATKIPLSHVLYSVKHCRFDNCVHRCPYNECKEPMNVEGTGHRHCGHAIHTIREK